MRLGVRAALVGSTVVDGDVAIDGRSHHGIGIGPGRRSGRELAVPGLVDLQVNGFAGVDFRTADRAGYEAGPRRRWPRVVPWPSNRPSTACRSMGTCAALRVLAAVIDDPPDGCRFLPAHLEGPFLSPLWRGAHDPATFRAPSIGDADTLLDAGPVGMMTVAPELPGAVDLIADLVGRGVVVSVGHTDADADAVRGARRRRRPPRHPRAGTRTGDSRPAIPDPPGVALTDERLTVGLIADLVHTDPEVVTMTARRLSGPAGRDHRRRRSRGHRPTTRPQSPRRRDAGRERRDAVGRPGQPGPMRSRPGGRGRRVRRRPAAVAGPARGHASRPGDPADLVVLDGEHRPTRTIVAGRTVWRSPDRPGTRT